MAVSKTTTYWHFVHVFAFRARVTYILWLILIRICGTLGVGLTGSTYVPLDDAMLTKSLLVDHSPRIRVVLYDYHSGNTTNPAQYAYSRSWPRNNYVCQMMDKERFGVSLFMIPGFNSNKSDTELLWLTCTTLWHCKEVCNIVDFKVSPFF